MNKLSLLSLPIALASWLALPASVADVAELVAKLKTEKDAAGEETIKALADVHTREAMQGLLDVYDSMDSLYMRREVLRALATFDGVEDAQQPALQKLTDAATQEQARELREAALKLLGDAQTLGKHFLGLIADSPADQSARIRAMELFDERYADEDFDFYLKIFRSGDEEPPKSKAKKGKEPEARVYPVPKLREIALARIGPKMDPGELVTAATKKERDPQDVQRDGVRRLALLELDRRKDKRAVDISRDVYKDTTENAENRVVAARILAREEGDNLAAQFLDDGLKSPDVTPVALRNELADQLSGWLANAKDKSLVAKLEKYFTAKGKEGPKLFAIRALSKAGDEKLAKSMAKLLSDPDPQVVIAVAESLRQRDDKTIVPDLEKALVASKKPEVQGALMDAIGFLKTGDPDWQKKLIEDAVSPSVEVRNAALWQLAKLGQARYFPIFQKALEDAEWSTRLAALKGLEILGTSEAIGVIIDHMAKEEGRMLRECHDALWHLTGKSFGPDQKQWKDWWEAEKAGFKGLGTGDLLRIKQEEDSRALKQASATKSTFYGVRIVSHRVIFIIDVSGSMNEPMHSSYLGKMGEPRIEVAKRELSKCIDALDRDALFNMVVFSGGVDRWIDGGIAQSKEKAKTDAKTFVSRLGAGGGTNLYGALEVAFSDKDVDTIYIMSDGEPTNGDVVDQAEIRARVLQWNEHRKVVINTVAVGGSYDILAWLAEDSGGTHVKYD
jgi:HEAT repeat protein